MDGSGGDYAKCNKSTRQSQLSYGFTYLGNIRNSMEDMRRRKGKMEGRGIGVETNQERLWTLGNKLRVLEGRGLGDG